MMHQRYGVPRRVMTDMDVKKMNEFIEVLLEHKMDGENTEKRGQSFFELYELASEERKVIEESIRSVEASEGK